MELDDGNLEAVRTLFQHDATHVAKAIDRSPVNPSPSEAGVYAFRLGHWPTRSAPNYLQRLTRWVCQRTHKPTRPMAEIGGSMAARAGAPGTPSGRRRFPLIRPGRQRKKCAVREFQIAIIDVHLAFPGAFALDHAFCADGKPAGKTA